MSDFKNITFNTPKNIQSTLSISSVLSLIKEPFDSEGVAQKTYDKHYGNPNSEYFGMTVQEIMDKWAAKGKASCHYGSLLDEYIGFNLNGADEMDLEMFKLDYDYDGDTRLHGLCDSFDTFVKEVLNTHPNLKFVTREQTVYFPLLDMGTPNPVFNENEPESDENPKMIYPYIKGRFDALFYNEDNGHYVIVDWKSSGSVDKKVTPWTGKLLGPCKNINDLNHNTYTMQVYFYKTALENNYLENGTKVDCIIVQLPGEIIAESNKNYCVHNPAFEYDYDFMNKLFIYAVKKQSILDKKITK